MNDAKTRGQKKDTWKCNERRFLEPGSQKPILTENVGNLEKRMLNLEQRSRLANIEIAGVPVTKNESPVEIVKKNWANNRR